MSTRSEMTPTTQSDEHCPMPSKSAGQPVAVLARQAHRGVGVPRARRREGEQPGGEPAARVVGSGQASGSCSPAFESQMRGIGLRAHVEPLGYVTSPSTKTALSPIGYRSVPLFHLSTCAWIELERRAEALLAERPEVGTAYGSLRRGDTPHATSTYAGDPAGAVGRVGGSCAHHALAGQARVLEDRIAAELLVAELALATRVDDRRGRGRATGCSGTVLVRALNGIEVERPRGRSVGSGAVAVARAKPILPTAAFPADGVVPDVSVGHLSS